MKYLLTDPFLQFPKETSVRVVWFTEFAGTQHEVVYGDRLEHKSEATTIKLSRMREDADSKVIPSYQETTVRDIWRHEAEVRGLTPGKRIPYRVLSVTEGEEIKSDIFTLTPNPKSGTPLKILLTSDHQLMPMVAANLQKVVETVGQVDAVFFAGDLVNTADRASEWFDERRGGAFFPCLQGHANYFLEKEGLTTVYQGAKLIQNAPIFTAIGNHEIMGKFSDKKYLKEQFDQTVPKQKAEEFYKNLFLELDKETKKTWIKNNSFNSDSYEEIFNINQGVSGGNKYYAVTFGDIRLVVLFVTNMWRHPLTKTDVKGRYQERQEDLNNPQDWGYGQHIFEPIYQGSIQYNWLKKELDSSEFKQAKYKLVMFHHPVHTLGGNIVPPYTDPVARIDGAPEGIIKSIRYDYPPENDYIIRDLIPLLEKSKVQLIFYGHSHLWNRFCSPSGINFLESSNVGNSYGAHVEDNKRLVPTDNPLIQYAAIGNPNGLEPILPNLAPLRDENNQPLPYIASNDITVFSILETKKGTVSSYYFDTRKPESEVVKFDEFDLMIKVS